MPKMPSILHDLPRFKVSTVLVDMDGTIVETLGEGDPFIEVLVRLLCRKRRIGEGEARSVMREEFDPDKDSLAEHLWPLGVSLKEYWEVLIPEMQKRVRPYSDAVEMIRILHERGFRLFPATSNSRLACLAKLAVAGLADMTGSKWFTDLFGGAEVHPLGKTGAEFFRSLLRRIAAKPEDTLMIGDSAETDLRFARDAEISKVIIVRRDRARSWELLSDGCLCVPSLELVPRIVIHKAFG